MKVSSKYQRMAMLYKYFANNQCKDYFDFSEAALEEMYSFESLGTEIVIENNGYFWGKKYLNLQVTSWMEGINEGTLFKFELYEDENFKEYHWWLDSIFSNFCYTPTEDNKKLWDIIIEEKKQENKKLLDKKL